MWLAGAAFEQTMIERLDAMFAAAECPDALDRVRRRVDLTRRLAVPQLDGDRAATWTTCATRSSRSSTSAIRRLAGREHRGIAGKSSGGYGAMVVPMLRPDVFGALASHAGDALFECCYLRDFPASRGHCATASRAPTSVFFDRLRADRTLRLGDVRQAVRDLRLRVCVLAGSGASRRAAAAVRRIDGAADRRGVGAVARARPGADGAELTPTRCGACGASISMPARPTSTSLTSVRRRSPRSSRSSASSTRSSYSMASTAGSPTGIRARSASSSLALGY